MKTFSNRIRLSVYLNNRGEYYLLVFYIVWEDLYAICAESWILWFFILILVAWLDALVFHWVLEWWYFILMLLLVMLYLIAQFSINWTKPFSERKLIATQIAIFISLLAIIGGMIINLILTNFRIRAIFFTAAAHIDLWIV